jgi:4-hydroxythreonine-4-phosphate dehydrogenase
MELEQNPSVTPPVIGISIGDVNGIGTELIIDVFSDPRILKFVTPVIYGSSKVLSYYRKMLNSKKFNFTGITSIDQVREGKLWVMECWNDEINLTPGQSTPESGKAAFDALKAATHDLTTGKIEGLVTCPIEKANIQGDEFRFPGHTEYITKESGARESLMMMVTEELKLGVVTGHIPLSEVPSKVTKELIIKKANIMNKSLKADFGISKPKIAVLGLNPHAGEKGLLGKEDLDVVGPAIEALSQKGILCMGPYPADGFFGSVEYRKFDGVLAMYHDQGLIPFKTIAFEKGVNFTAGLSVVRSSPDHGTAFSLVGRNKASSTSFREALYVAIDVVNTRKETSVVAS